MTKALTRASDRLLGMFLPRAEAGACCGCAGGTCKCVSHKLYILDCAGICVYSGRSC